MENKEQYKRMVKILSTSLILLLQTAIFAVVWYICYANNEEALIEPFWRRGNYVIIGLYAVMVFLFYKLYGGFKVGYLRHVEVLYSQIFSTICVNAVTYLQLCLIGHWRFGLFATPILVMTVVDIVVAVLWGFFTQWAYLKIYPPREMVLIYGKYSPKYLIQKMASRKDKYTISETIHYSAGLDEIKAKILKYRCVVMSDIPSEIRNQLLKFCFEKDIRCYTVPKITDIMIMSATDIHLFDTALLLFRNQGLTADQEAAKRIFDIVISVLAIIVTSPIMALIALFIKLYDGGPVIFTQDRLTKNGKIFKVQKFRSMRVEPVSAEYCLTRKDDDRVTPVGKVIRAIHFDELPQFFNILKGDMSFVGPRPECPKIAEEYSQIIPEFNYRLKVKAGLTGFAQVYGKYNTTPYDKLKMDLSYIENYSFLLDLKLILLTLKILFQKSNTEGIESWQTSAAIEEDLEKISK